MSTPTGVPAVDMLLARYRLSPRSLDHHDGKLGLVEIPTFEPLLERFVYTYSPRQTFAFSRVAVMASCSLRRYSASQLKQSASEIGRIARTLVRTTGFTGGVEEYYLYDGKVTVRVGYADNMPDTRHAWRLQHRNAVVVAEGLKLLFTTCTDAWVVPP